MFNGYLMFDDTEFVNHERTTTYIENFMPSLEVKCDRHTNLWRAVHPEGSYVSPSVDGAPWYKANSPGSGNFYGFMVKKQHGIEDSTRTVEATELSEGGAVHSLAHHKAKEIRLVLTAYAKDTEGMNAGMTWLRSLFNPEPCGPFFTQCHEPTMNYFTASPASASDQTAANLYISNWRTLYRVQAIDGPRVTQEQSSRSGPIWEVEVLLSAGTPWAFTLFRPVTTTTSTTGTNISETPCPPPADAWDDVVTDPLGSAVVRPPRPPVIVPPAMPSSWVRRSDTIAAGNGARNGSMVPMIEVTTDVAVRNLRVRYYRDGYEGLCDFEGEFLITYLPANAYLVIDGALREIRLSIGTKMVSGSNLVTGTAGRPALWPTLACGTSYMVTVDSVGSLAGVVVSTSIANRE